MFAKLTDGDNAGVSGARKNHSEYAGIVHTRWRLRYDALGMEVLLS